jgi:hypothetical protein
LLSYRFVPTASISSGKREDTVDLNYIKVDLCDYSVADPDLGSGAFLIPVAGIRIQDSDPGREKYRSGIQCCFDPGIRIRNKSRSGINIFVRT